MRPPARIAFLGLCLSAACSSPDGPEACRLGQDLYRCNGNELQLCLGGSFFGAYVPPEWATMDTCVAPEVCRVGTNPEVPPALQSGCFEPGSTCSDEGWALCYSPANGSLVPVDLWTCSRSAQDRTLQWSLTRCDLQSPQAICGTGPERSACFEVAGACASSPLASRCDGDLAYFCSGPTIVDGKAVFDWVLIADCAATGTVCRDGICVKP